MLMVLVTTGFFMYTMYLQRQRELQNPQSAAKAQTKTARFNIPQQNNPFKTTGSQPAQNFSAPIPQYQQQQQQPTSVFGGADVASRIPIQQQQQQHRMPLHTVPAVY